MNVYSIFDKKVAAYGQPFFALNDQAAKRMVSMASAERNSLLRVFPEDYTLERLGTFDESSGQLDSEKPSTVASVSALVLRDVDVGESESESPTSPPWDEEKPSSSPS